MLRDLCIPRVDHASLHRSAEKIINNSSHETDWELNIKPCLTTQKAGRMSPVLKFLVGGVRRAPTIIEWSEQLQQISASWGIESFNNEGSGI
jgi:hypothetical protein